MKNATFRQLRVFNEVARHLSFARAAEALHLTPPAVTMQIKELEGHVGLPLFERSGRQVALTTAGEYMLVYARKVLATLKDARRQGLAVLLISADLDELIGLSDRIEVILRGQLVGEFDPSEVTPQQLGSAMTGAGEQA